MGNRIQNRVHAYHFIQAKLQEANYTRFNGDDLFSLEDLHALKHGDSDPSDELIAGLRHALRGFVTLQEFEDTLIRPFREPR